MRGKFTLFQMASLEVCVLAAAGEVGVYSIKARSQGMLLPCIKRNIVCLNVTKVETNSDMCLCASGSQACSQLFPRCWKTDVVSRGQADGP